MSRLAERIERLEHQHGHRERSYFEVVRDLLDVGDRVFVKGFGDESSPHGAAIIRHLTQELRPDAADCSTPGELWAKARPRIVESARRSAYLPGERELMETLA